MPPRKTRQSPATKPETLKVVPLTRPTEEQKRPGRKPKRKMPPLPKEILDGMSELEREHFEYFVHSILEENPDLAGSDLILVNLAGLDYINTLRLEQNQLASGELVTMSRQHPGVQFRAWLAMLSASRKDRLGSKTNQSEQGSRRAELIEMSQW
jgi:hypothetical protein